MLHGFLPPWLKIRIIDNMVDHLRLEALDRHSRWTIPFSRVIPTDPKALQIIPTGA